MNGAGDFEECTVLNPAAGWPMWAQKAAEAIGPDAVAKILTHYAGESLYIPKGIQEGHPLAVLIDHAAARVLCLMFAGESFNIPAAVPVNAESAPIEKPVSYADGNGNRDFLRLEDYWPAWVKEAVELVGPESVGKLLQRYGGARLYVPKIIDADHPISQLIGFEAAQIFSAAYGGLEHFDIPNGKNAETQYRHRLIMAELASGRSTSQVALRYRLTERQVRNIYRKKRESEHHG